MPDIKNKFQSFNLTIILLSTYEPAPKQQANLNVVVEF